MAEKLLFEAQSRGLPVSIYRSGFILGDSPKPEVVLAPPAPALERPGVVVTTDPVAVAVGRVRGSVVLDDPIQSDRKGIDQDLLLFAVELDGGFRLAGDDRVPGVDRSDESDPLATVRRHKVTLRIVTPSAAP